MGVDLTMFVGKEQVALGRAYNYRTLSAGKFARSTTFNEWSDFLELIKTYIAYTPSSKEEVIEMCEEAEEQLVDLTHLTDVDARTNLLKFIASLNDNITFKHS